MEKEEAVRLLLEEMERCKRAPELNGCEMKPEWQRTMDVCRVAVEAIREQEERKWISCKDQIPGKKQKVVFYNPGNEAVYAGKFNFIGERGSVWFRVGKVSYIGSHWMPMPEPPKEE